MINTRIIYFNDSSSIFIIFYFMRNIEFDYQIIPQNNIINRHCEIRVFFNSEKSRVCEISIVYIQINIIANQIPIIDFSYSINSSVGCVD